MTSAGQPSGKSGSAADADGSNDRMSSEGTPGRWNRPRHRGSRRSPLERVIEHGVHERAPAWIHGACRAPELAGVRHRCLVLLASGGSEVTPPVVVGVFPSLVTSACGDASGVAGLVAADRFARGAVVAQSRFSRHRRGVACTGEADLHRAQRSGSPAGLPMRTGSNDHHMSSRGSRPRPPPRRKRRASAVPSDDWLRTGERRRYPSLGAGRPAARVRPGFRVRAASASDTRTAVPGRGPRKLRPTTGRLHPSRSQCLERSTAQLARQTWTAVLRLRPASSKALRRTAALAGGAEALAQRIVRGRTHVRRPPHGASRLATGICVDAGRRQCGNGRQSTGLA